MVELLSTPAASRVSELAAGCRRRRSPGARTATVLARPASIVPFGVPRRAIGDWPDPARPRLMNAASGPALFLGASRWQDRPAAGADGRPYGDRSPRTGHLGRTAGAAWRPPPFADLAEPTLPLVQEFSASKSLATTQLYTQVPSERLKETYALRHRANFSSMTPPTQEPRFGWPMSDERRYRLRRTIAFLAAIRTYPALVVKLTGSDAPAGATSAAMSTAQCSRKPRPAAGHERSSSASAPRLGADSRALVGTDQRAGQRVPGALTAAAIPGSDTDRWPAWVRPSVRPDVERSGVDSAALAAGRRVSILSGRAGLESRGPHSGLAAVSPAQPRGRGARRDRGDAVQAPQLTGQRIHRQTLGEVSCNHATAAR